MKTQQNYNGLEVFELKQNRFSFNKKISRLWRGVRTIGNRKDLQANQKSKHNIHFGMPRKSSNFITIEALHTGLTKDEERLTK